MDAKDGKPAAFDEKGVHDGAPAYDHDDIETVSTSNTLHKDLKGRHMQMIAMFVFKSQ